MAQNNMIKSNQEEILNILKGSSSLSVEFKKMDVLVKWKAQPDSDLISEFIIDNRLFLFLIKELNLFKDLHILGSKSVVMYKDCIYAIAGCSKSQSLTMMKTSLNIRGTEYELLIGPLNPISISILNKHGINKSLDEIGTLETIPALSIHDDLQPSSVKLTTHESEYTWLSMTIAVLLSHFDPNPKLVEIRHRGMPSPIPTLSAGDNFMIRIKPLESQTEEQKKFILESWESILNYIIFEYYKSQDLILHLSDFAQKQDELILKINSERMSAFASKLMYRPINSLLVEYVKVAEETNSEGFRYLSYYHILEHFFRDSVLEKISKEIQRVLLGMDFLSSPKEHTTRIAHLVTKELPRGEPKELDALKAVLNRFLPSDFMEKIPESMKEHIEKVAEFDGDFSIPGINKNTPNQLDELGTRIYRIRNSIVHSKEDFGDGEGHILLTKKNKQLLIIETKLIKRVIDYVIKQSGIP